MVNDSKGALWGLELREMKGEGGFRPSVGSASSRASPLETSSKLSAMEIVLHSACTVNYFS